MQDYLFESWLNEQSYANSRVVGDNRSRCKRIERELAIVLDEEYSRDGLSGVLFKLRYTAEDLRNGVPVPLGLNVTKPVQSLSTLSTAVRNYCSFRQAGAIEGPRRREGSFEDLKNAFGVWLKDEEELSANSANSYKSYLNQLKTAFEESHGTNSFDLLADAIKNKQHDLASQQIRLCQDFILRNKIDDAVHTKDWSNRFSAFNRYVDYLEDFFEYDNEVVPEAEPETIPETAAEPSALQRNEPNEGLSFSLSHKELLIKFRNRIKTQSRAYQSPEVNIMFPVRLISSIFRMGRDNRFKEMIDRDLANMAFLGEGETNCIFSNVCELNFDGRGGVVVHKNDGSEFVLYTKSYAADDSVIRKKMNAYTSDILSIDHTTPMENIVRRRRNELTALKTITEYFGEFNSDQRLNAKEDRKWKDSFLAQYPQLDTDEFRNQLFADLNLIHVEYEIMDKRENSRRGNRA